MKRQADHSNSSGNHESAKRSRSNKTPENKPTHSSNCVGSNWPEYFHSLFKVFKAINTVLAFVSSKRHLPTTFSAVRSSAEGLLRHPIELTSIAELKALLPDLIKFSYIPFGEVQVNEDDLKSKRSTSVDVKASIVESSRDEDGYVLVLDFTDIPKGKKTRNTGFSYTIPQTMSPAAVTNLVKKRNELFQRAVEEFLLASKLTDSPEILIQEAAYDYIPVKPSSPLTNNQQINIIVPSVRTTICDILVEIEQQSWYKDQIVFRKSFEAKSSQTAELDDFPRTISQALFDSRNISSLYIHQVEAIRAINTKNVIVSTSTASGKSVIYQIPVIASLQDESGSTAMFIYPTKALAQDQKRSFEQLLFCCPDLKDIQVATYDGDTPQKDRARIRESFSIIFTNFDTIHSSILPHEGLWRRFLKNLKIVAIDELHYYTGLLGTHVAFVIRRFRRVCAAVGNKRIRFVSCTATISNPRNHMCNLLALDSAEIEVVSKDGSPSGRKDFVVWKTPLIDPNDPSLGCNSPLSEATGLMAHLMKCGVRVILFCKIRKICELAMKTIRASLSNEGRYDILEKVRPYRGGYSQESRRRFEQEAFSGHLLGIIATNALELGVDIGVLDAVIMLGFPGSISSFRQQAGRAGRRSKDSLAVLVADQFAIDQYYVNHPTELFEKSSDDIVVNLSNEMILEAHLQCAAYEMPLSTQDEEYFGPLMKDICERRLIKDKDGWYHTHPNLLPSPSVNVSLRGIQEEKYAVVQIHREGEPKTILEEVEYSRSMFEVYEGGVFMHQGLAFIVKEVSHDSKIAKVVRSDVNYITSPRDFTNIDAVETYRVRTADQGKVYYGKIHVCVKVFGFFKIRHMAILDAVDIETPPWEYDTTGLWMDVKQSTLELLRSKNINLAEAIHAAEHAFLNQFSLSEDVRTECKASEKEYKVTESQRKRPGRLIFYDPFGKGGGHACKAFDDALDILRKAVAAIESCPCEEGCLQCVQSPACKEGNRVSSKIGAFVIMNGILGVHLDPDSITSQTDTKLPETIVEALTVKGSSQIQLEDQ